MMIEKHFRLSSYTIFLYATWSRFMMIAVLKRDWCIPFTVWILQNKGFWKLCPYSSPEFVIQCCSSSSARCVSLTGDFHKRHSKTFSSKIVILITGVTVIPFISQSDYPLSLTCALKDYTSDWRDQILWQYSKVCVKQ